MGNNPIPPIPPPVIRTYQDRGLAILRQLYVDGKLDLAAFEERIGLVMNGGNGLDGLPTIPPRDPGKRVWS